MSAKKPSINISRLVLVGARKDYEVYFSKGVNVVYGDSATGKSSILECINYAFGSKKLDYDREIESAVDYVQLEVEFNGKPCVIRRNVFRPADFIEVYAADLASMKAVFPKKYTPFFNADAGPDGYFSDFLMDALNLPSVRMRQAPSRADSIMVRLSFRDLFKYCYLKQDDVGGKGLLGAGTVIEAKNKETFKYIFNLLDTNVSDAQSALSALVSEHAKLIEKYKLVSDFLRETEFDSETTLVDSDRDLADQEVALRLQLGALNKSMVADSDNYKALRIALDDISTKIKYVENQKSDAKTSVDRYVRLKNDYQNDISKLKSARHARSVIGRPEESFSCPVCDSSVSLATIKESFSITDEDRVAQEVNSLARRIRELDDLVRFEKEKIVALERELRELIADRDKARRLIDDEMSQMVTPYLSERDGIASELAKTEERRRRVSHLLKVRNQQKQILASVSDYAEKIERMEEKLSKLKAAAPSLATTLSSLGDFLGEYLRHVKVKDQRDVSISARSFLPVFRGRDYRDITSGGLRTVLSIGHFLGLAKSAISSEINLPSFLMIDTVGKYLGKTQTRYTETNSFEDTAEELSDPQKYMNMYEYMFVLAAAAEKNGEICQIILVDNDLPPDIQAKYDTSVVAHFSKVGLDGLPRGLIDDAYLYES